MSPSLPTHTGTHQRRPEQVMSTSTVASTSQRLRHVHRVLHREPRIGRVTTRQSGAYDGVARAIGIGGDMARTAPPSGVVTFLFTDIEGSTRRWEADAD